MPNTATSTLADSASVIVSRKRDGTFSSITTRGNAMMISDGIGTMKRLIRPTRMSTSTARISTASEPSPSAHGEPAGFAERQRGAHAVPPDSPPPCGEGSGVGQPRVRTSK